ncbi:MAG: hypothetical protein JOZ49_15815 [Mycolicibacterium sp.]|nr:hypothetical protein [Mycolicibacterium sp.]
MAWPYLADDRARQFWRKLINAPVQCLRNLGDLLSFRVTFHVRQARSKFPCRHWLL